jgi:hypothetical protein
MAVCLSQIWIGGYPALDITNPDNDSDMMGDVEYSKLHRVAKVDDLLKMLEHSNNVRATQEESRTLNMQTTAVGYI